MTSPNVLHPAHGTTAPPRTGPGQAASRTHKLPTGQPPAAVDPTMTAHGRGPMLLGLVVTPRALLDHELPGWTQPVNAGEPATTAEWST
jgi:hypothetical protein